MKLIGLLFLILLLTGCANKQEGTPRVGAEPKRLVGMRPPPALGPARKLAPGVLFHEVLLARAEGANKLWVYLPEQLRGEEKIPCVIIAPAGSRLFHGMRLTDGDRPEHLPYVRAGFAVIAYEIDGPLIDDPLDHEVAQAVKAFENAEAGLANARLALTYAAAMVPQIDPTRIYSAGHSSAATLSLLVAAHEPKIKACVAFAPVANVAYHLGSQTLNYLSALVPDVREFLARSSPATDPSTLRCPLFLFHAEDDSVVPISGSADFAQQVKKTNPDVTFVRASGGDHYDSMIREGVPQAIKWLKQLK